VRIELWKGGTFNSLINASTPSTGSCYWAIPATLPNGNDYKVKILAVSNSGAVTLYDFSDNNFSITGMSPTPMLTPLSVVRIYPNPGNSRIHVLFEGEYQGSVTIDIFNFQGDLALQQVMESVSKDESVGIATASLPDGNYLVVVKKDGTTISRNNLLIRH
jgi:hypothetical protein